jgi:hypothetical protein
MKLYLDDETMRGIELAFESMTSDELRKLAALTGEKVPTRKLDIANVIVRHLEGEGLRAVWEGLDELQRAAVAEVVHSPSATFSAGRFRANPPRTWRVTWPGSRFRSRFEKAPGSRFATTSGKRPRLSTRRDPTVAAAA